MIPVSTPVIAALQGYGVPRCGPVFHNEHGQALPPWKVSHLLSRHMHACGMTATAHQLRHTFGTEVYRQSHDLRLTQALMGHSSPLTTSSYVAWAQEREAAIVAMLFT